jgi:hypothetical protein
VGAAGSFCYWTAELGNQAKLSGTGTIRPHTLLPRIFHPRAIHPRMFFPGVFTSPYVSSLKCGTIFRVRLG